MDITPIKDAVYSELQKESYSSLRVVSAHTGISVPGLQKMRLGTRQNPRFSTVAALAAYYRLDTAVLNGEKK